MSPDERAKYNDFVTRSFRDIADQDYIAARVLHRLGLHQQFLWAALQSVEKYLKAILLFNDVGAKNLGHDIEKAFARLAAIPDITFDIPADVGEFIRRLNAQGANRYFEYPFHVMGEELLQLDRAVWYMRRYCQYIRGVAVVQNGSPIPLFDPTLRIIQCPDTLKHPHKFRLIGGYLEKQLRTKSILRENLVRNNFYFGENRKRVRSIRITMASATPSNFMFPEIFHLLNDRVSFSKEVKQHFLGTSP